MPIKKTTKEKTPIAWKTVESPYISEKATELSKDNRYLFKVMSHTNKTQIKQAIKELYGVDVISVRTINILRKKKRLGRHKGWVKGFKKAIVQIKEGQRISFD